MEINGAKMFVKALQEEGVDTLFAYPGGTAIDLFDALYDAEGIDMILPRHEQALVHAADGYARSTGRAGFTDMTQNWIDGDGFSILINIMKRDFTD